MGLIIIAVMIALIMVVVMNMSKEADINEEFKKNDFDIDPKIGDFGIDPSDIELTPVVEKPKKKYKRRTKKKPTE